MEVLSHSAYVESNIRLAIGEDFTEDQLKPDRLFNGELMLLTVEARRKIAVENGYDECVWSGHYHEEDGTVQVILRKMVPGDVTKVTDCTTAQIEKKIHLYNKKIRPHMAEIIRICKTNKFSFAAQFMTSDKEFFISSNCRGAGAAHVDNVLGAMLFEELK